MTRVLYILQSIYSLHTLHSPHQNVRLGGYYTFTSITRGSMNTNFVALKTCKSASHHAQILYKCVYHLCNCLHIIMILRLRHDLIFPRQRLVIVVKVLVYYIANTLSGQNVTFKIKSAINRVQRSVSVWCG